MQPRLLTQRSLPDKECFLTEDELPESLMEVLDNPDMRAEFMLFLQARLANENLLFYESIELFEQIKKPKTRSEKGIQIVKTFVEVDSELWINLPSKIRENLVKKKQFGNQDFQSAKQELFNLMNINFFEKFCSHLQGLENNSAPKLSFDSSFSLTMLRSSSFEQLATSLEDSIWGEDEATVGRSLSSSNCTCKVSRGSVGKSISRFSSRKGEPKVCESCTHRRKMRGRIAGLTAHRSDMSNVSLRERLGMSIKPPTAPKTPKKRGSLSMSMMRSLFKRRPSRTKALTMWQEVETTDV